MKIQKLNESAVIPTRGSDKAAGLDLYANENFWIESGNWGLVSTGIAVAIPKNYYGRIAPRSGLAVNHGINVMAGVIDEDYRGELKVVLINHGRFTFEIKKGDRIAQLIIESISRPVIEIVDNLEYTPRGADSFGSTGLA